MSGIDFNRHKRSKWLDRPNEMIKQVGWQTKWQHAVSSLADQGTWQHKWHNRATIKQEDVTCHGKWQVRAIDVTDQVKPGFHTCVSRTHNSAQCLTMYGHQWSQAITAFATKPCELATKLHMLNFCKGLRGICRDMLWLWPIETNNARHNKYFLSFGKKEQN